MHTLADISVNAAASTGIGTGPQAAAWPLMPRGWQADPVTGRPPTTGFAGCFDFIDEAHGLRGWVVDFAQPDAPPPLEIYCGSRRLGSTTTRFERPDIETALGAQGRFGFAAAWDSFDLDEVFAAEAEDPEAPVLVTCGLAGQILPRIGEPLAIKDLAARAAAAARRGEVARIPQDLVESEGGLLGRLVSRSGDGGPGGARVATTWMDSAVAADTDWDLATGSDLQDAPSTGTAPPSRRDQIEALRASGLFDAAHFARHNPDLVAASVPLLEHYFDTGFLEGRNPNPMFDGAFYLAEHPQVTADGVQPLYHYLTVGEAEGCRPSRLFDPGWYRATFAVPPDACALVHYLAHRHGGRVSPIPEFDAAYYVRTYPDIAAAGLDPFAHFMEAGFREGRNPSETFDTRFYMRRYLRRDPGQNPLLHWLEHRHEAGVHPSMPADETTTHREIRRFARPGSAFETFRPLPAAAPRLAKVLAYYLPQFHTFPENDRWWGRGFTEWTNIQRGVPRFAGHYQPRIPRDLGHYTLDGTGTMRRQAEMARAGGVHGFVFYYYWFNGKRLLDRPVEAFLDDPSVDMPFALMWANENWTRRWDGFDSEVLISQDYRAEDAAAMVAAYARHFRDPRYIRVQGRPLLMIYRPRLIPDAAATVASWRRLFREGFGEDPLLVMAQGFGDEDPTAFGLDGAIEFPPHKVAADLPNDIGTVELLDPDFDGIVIDYDRVVEKSLALPTPAYPLIKGAVPSWDNDARRQGTGMVLQGSTPAKYEAWLARLVEHAAANPFLGEPFVVVNAWNEWAEGAYLEPDQHFGAAYLNATARAVTGAAEAAPAVLLVGHDAHPHGAQELFWHIGRTLRRRFGVQVEYLLLDGGEMQPRYEEIAPTTLLGAPGELGAVLAGFRARGFRTAIVNTSAAAHAIQPAAGAGIACTLLVHELPRLITAMKLAVPLRAALQGARHVVFPAVMVRDAVLAAVGGDAPRAEVIVRPQGLYKPVVASAADGARIRAALGLAEGERLVLCIGFADMRKGFDLFLQAWRLMRRLPGPRVHFCWLGKVEIPLRQWLGQEIDSAIAEGSFHLPGFTDAVPAYLAAADAFALTSREDPFPSVALEALCSGLPVVAFAASGGIPELLEASGAGRVVPYGDVPALAEALAEEMAAHGDAAAETRRRLMVEGFAWPDYIGDLLGLALPGLGRVSVAVPNYNYARYMPERLGSIFRQACPVQEVLVLDDCSTDDSLAAIAAVSGDWQRDIRLLANAVNSGSVFAQWRRAAEEAQGEFVWIAEADDAADPAFLPRLLSLLRDDPAIRFAFCDSRAVDAEGRLLGASYKPYYATVEPGALEQTEVFAAADFVRRFLSVKNLILNVSAVVWRRDALLRALDACGTELAGFRMAGDWRLYLEALAEPGARIAYEAAPLNQHRRHAQSVTHALHADRHLAEIGQVHALAAGLFAPDAAVAAAQQAYLREVAAQLGAAPR